MAADAALLDIEAGGLLSPTTQRILVVAPLPIFVALQVVPPTRVARSTNAVDIAVVSVASPAFPLDQIHFDSGVWRMP